MATEKFAAVDGRLTRTTTVQSVETLDVAALKAQLADIEVGVATYNAQHQTQIDELKRLIAEAEKLGITT